MYQGARFESYMYLALVIINCFGICQSDKPNESSNSSSGSLVNRTMTEEQTREEIVTGINDTDTFRTVALNDSSGNLTQYMGKTHTNRIYDMMDNYFNNTTTHKTGEMANVYQPVHLHFSTSEYFSDANKMDSANFVRFWDNTMCGGPCLPVLDNITTNFIIISVNSCDGCFCDGCSVYGDCCLDKVLDGETVNNSLLQYTSCSSPTQGFRNGSKEDSYILVTKCPVDYSDDIVRVNCENLSNQFETILNNPPVHSHKSQMNYLNSHCAECHADLDNLTEWTSQITCRKAVKLSNIKTKEDLIHLLNTNVNCSMFSPPIDSLSRPCKFNVGEIISECNVTEDVISFNTDLETACGLYVNPVTVDSQKYLNVFCALCNGKRSSVMKKWEELRKKRQVHPPVPSFSIIFNLRPTAKLPDELLVDSKCPDGSVFIPKSSCRKLVCSPGHIVMSRSCEDAFKSAKGLGFRLRYHILPNGQSQTFLDRQDIDKFWMTYLAHIVKHFPDDMIQLHALFLNVTMQICFQSTNVTEIVSVENVTTSIKTIIGWDISQRLAELRLLQLFESEREFNNTVWTIETVAPDNLSLCDRGFQCRSFTSITWGNFSDEYFINDDAFIPLTPMSRCNQTELLPGEYSLNYTTGLLRTNVTGMEYKIGEYNIDGDTVRICLNVSTQETHIGTHKDKLFQMTIKWVTAISMGISICCLFLTIAVCVAVRTQHTQPGKITLALVSTLIVAQLLFITSGQASTNLWGCRIVGMAIHYLWLTVFGWKQVAGYHMYVSFVHPFKKSFSNSITFVKYMLYAFGVPFVIVVCYTVTHIIMSNKENIGYGDNACFLSSPLNIGVAFVLPVSLVLISNVFFFCRIVYVIKKMSEIEKHSNRADTNHSIIFMKMSILLGFTWIVGFLANIVNNEVMWYTFAALNAGIGLFIFLGQIWNKHVLGKIRRALDLGRTSESVTATTYSTSQ